jgi:lysyl-tRNA synthetase class 2
VLLCRGDRALLRDASGNLELRLPAGAAAPPLGAWVSAEGAWDGAAVVATTLEVLTVPVAPFPVPNGEFEWFQGDDGRRAENLRKRADVLGAIREVFDGSGFVEVETPLVVQSPGLEVHLAAFEVVGSSAPRYLSTSPEYHMKRLLAGGLPRIYQICRCFRRDEAGERHEPEFTMLEWYRAFAGAEAIMHDTEELVAHVARAVNDGSTVVVRGGRAIDLAPPWDRLTVAEAFERHAGVRVEDVLPDETRFFELLATRIEPALGLDRPVFLTHWPRAMASLARLHPNDPSVAERVEAFAAGIELSNGFSELVDPVEQRARLEEDDRTRATLGLPRYPIDERFLGALAEGLPPSAGNALGVDRLVMLLLGEAHIEDVVAFPSRRA